MYIILITNPNNVDKEGKVLQWREFITDAVDCAVRIRECKEKGWKVERYSSKKNIKED